MSEAPPGRDPVRPEYGPPAPVPGAATGPAPRRRWWTRRRAVLPLVAVAVTVLVATGLSRGQAERVAPAPASTLWSVAGSSSPDATVPPTTGSVTPPTAPVTTLPPGSTVPEQPAPPVTTTVPPPASGAAGDDPAGPGADQVPVATVPRGPYPPAGVDASPVPIGTPAALEVEDPRYAFTATQADGVSPVTYDPCRPIRYVTRPDNAPPDAAALVRSSFDRITQVTGLQFVDAGTTDEAPGGEDRPAYQPERYGDRWAPVLVAWATEAEVPALAGPVAGAAGSVSARVNGGTQTYVSGAVVLDGPQLSAVYADPAVQASVRAVVLHEMAHLVGLAHVDDASQLMNPQSSTTTTVLDFQAGDLTGLARLGAGACNPQL